MPLFLDAYLRLDPAAPAGDLDGGFAARVADPAWFLGRQWQLGEHQGEDAASPVLVRYRVVLAPLVDPMGRDAVHAPTEALVEAAPDEWWTPGRRVREGRRATDRAAGDPLLAERLAVAGLQVADLPPPYAFLNGRVADGLALFRRRAELGLPDEWFAHLPEEARRPAGVGDGWNPARFEFEASLAAGEVELRIPRHDGGRVDWYACEARPRAAGGEPIRESGVAIPTRLDYAGAPAPRWWQIEERQFDVGGFPPDRSHFATLLLIDLVSSHADDWFLVPIDTWTPSLGHLVTVEALEVVDSFGGVHALAPPGDGWSLFAVDGLPPWSLPLLPTTVPLAGPPIDEVDVSLDEDGNLVWAREVRVAGRETHAAPGPAGREAEEGGDPRGQRYEPSGGLSPHWHPYVEPVDAVSPSEHLEVRNLRLIGGRRAPVLRFRYAAEHTTSWTVSSADGRFAVAAFLLPPSSGSPQALPLDPDRVAAAPESLRVAARGSAGQILFEELVPVPR